jgi:zinc transport system substrate-binding protein
MFKILIMAFLIISTSHAMQKDVTVSIMPQKYFVQKIAGDKINVNVMVKPGFSPATYEPKTSQMKKLSKSIIYFAVDVAFEDVWLDIFKNSNKNMLIVDTANGITKLEMKEHSHHEDKEEKEEETHDEHDDHKGLDPHIWNDPILVKQQAKNIVEALIKVDSLNADFYKENYESFIKELDVLDNKLSRILAPYKNKAFMVFHPSWGYFAHRYSLEEVAIETQGKEPKPNELIELIKDAKEHKIKIVFVASQFSQKSAKIIANSINGNVVVINPLAANWSQNLIKTAQKIANTYK